MADYATGPDGALSPRRRPVHEMKKHSFLKNSNDGREHRARSLARLMHLLFLSTKYIGSLTIGVNQHILAGGASRDPCTCT